MMEFPKQQFAVMNTDNEEPFVEHYDDPVAAVESKVGRDTKYATVATYQLVSVQEMSVNRSVHIKIRKPRGAKKRKT